jgi:8-oxo-dGTP pyrophosphatase MutT (NUDIX family)
MNATLPEMLAVRLQQPLPGPDARVRFSPELSYGRHFGPAPEDARRAAVVCLLYPHRDEWYLPLMVRPTSMFAHGGQISLPGGAIEPDESSQQAAFRELQEELGVGGEGIELLGKLSPLYVYVSDFLVTPWVAALRQRPDLQPNPHEVAEVLEIPLAHLLDSKNYGQHRRQQRGLSMTAPHIQWGRHRIWGATSMILGELLAVISEVVDESVLSKDKA